MGNLRYGFYTRGYKTSLEIYGLTGMIAQDTVFNTDTNERLTYDGTNWLAGNQKTLTIYQVESLDAYVTISGCIVIPAPFSDTPTNTLPIIKATTPTGSNRNGIGVLRGTFQYPKMITQNSSEVLQYSGLAYTLYEGYTGTFSGIQGTYVNKSTAPGGTPPGFFDFMPVYGRAKSDAESLIIGNFGVWATRPTAQTLTFFRPDDGIYATAYFSQGLASISLIETF